MNKIQIQFVLVPLLLAIGFSLGMEKPTTIFEAIANDNFTQVEALLKNIDSQMLKKALTWAAFQGKEECVELILKRNDKKDSQPGAGLKDFDDFLIEASLRGDANAVDALLKNGARNGKRYHQRTALSWAAWKGYPIIVDMLIKSEVAKDDKEEALFQAVVKGHREVVKSLLSAGVQSNIQDAEGFTPLMIAVINGYEEIADILIKAGALLETQRISDGKAQTAVTCAFETGEDQMKDLLLRHGAKINPTDVDLNSALRWAASRGDEKKVGLLLKAGADLDAKNYEGKTALHYAVYKGHHVIAQLLVRAGADLGVQDIYGRTPEMLAKMLITSRGDEDMIEILTNPQFSYSALEFTCSNDGFSSQKKFIIITDLEPDDRIALHVVAARIPREDVLFVGTTLLHAGRKKILTRRLLDQLKMESVPVYQGTGGTADEYDDIASSRAAREYTHEGEGLLSADELEAVNRLPRSSDELQKHLIEALKSYDTIEIILLAPPTDLVGALKLMPELKKNIKHIHVMGGWTELKATGKNELIKRSTYNWNMDPAATAQLLDISDIAMTLYSSDNIKNCFNGGSIHRENYFSIIQQIQSLEQKIPSIGDQKIASLSWDSHLIEKIPALKNVIGPYQGNQFSPADVLVIIGIVNSMLIKKTKAIDVSLDVHDMDSQKGFLVNVSANPASKIKIVEEIDSKVFENELLLSLDVLKHN